MKILPILDLPCVSVDAIEAGIWNGFFSGGARQGPAGPGKAWPGGARRGAARQGKGRERKKLPPNFLSKRKAERGSKSANHKNKMKKVSIEIEGVSHLIFNNGSQINPLDPIVKAKKKITGKKTKTDEDHIEIFRLEMMATPYWKDGKGLYLPVENVSACFHGAAKKRKLGRQAIAFLPDPTFEGVGFAIDCHLSKSEKFLTHEPYMFIKNVNVSGRSVMKCRARIPGGWKAKISGTVDEGMMELADVEDLWNIAGTQIGFGDWRPSSPKSPGRNGIFRVINFEAS